MLSKPTAGDIQDYLGWCRSVGFNRPSVELISGRNHLIFKVQEGEKVRCLRMVNPESPRRGEWIKMEEEHAILQALGPTRLGPKAYYLGEYAAGAPFVVQEFVEGVRLGKAAVIREHQLRAVARAIALLNEQDLSPEKLPFMKKYVRRGYRGSKYTWAARLVGSVARMPRRDVFAWVVKITPLAIRVWRLLANHESLLPKNEWTFHFDGAHAGNIVWCGGEVRFIDWERVSWRNDRTFTLVRFATSIVKPGKASGLVLGPLLHEYCEVRPTPNFLELAWARWLERRCADLVWVLWNYTRRRQQKKLPVEKATDVTVRYEELRGFLEETDRAEYASL